jgi:branched-chain amino acid transport system substrate-binding protein
MIRCILLVLLSLECIAVGPLFSAETVKVASIFAFSGIAASANRIPAQGVRYGVDEINSRGGIQGHQIELIEIDNKSTPIGSKVAADLAVKKGVSAIIGASWSSHSLAIAKVAQSAGIPMISTDSTHPQVTRIGDYIFRVCYTDPFQGRMMAHFASTELQAKTASILFDVTSSYSTGLARVFAEQFKNNGGTIDKVLYYKTKQDNFRSEMQELKQAESDILFIPGHYESAGILFEAEKVGIKSVFLGCDGWGAISSFKKGGQKISSGYYSTHWSESIQSPRSRKFVEKYKKEEELLSFEPLGYDAVLLLADALTRAGSLEPEQIKTALQQTESFQGVTANISFNEDGDPIKSMVIIQIQDGETEYLKSIAPDQLEIPATRSQEASD